MVRTCASHLQSSVVAYLWVFMPFVLSEWNYYLVIVLAFAEYSTSLPWKNSWLLLQYVLGHCLSVLWSAVRSTLKHLAESVQKVHPYNSSGCFCLLSHHQQTLVTQCHWQHAHAITLPPLCFTKDVVCFGSWAVPGLLHIFFFPSFWYRLILVSSVQRMLFQYWAGFKV